MSNQEYPCALRLHLPYANTRIFMNLLICTFEKLFERHTQRYIFYRKANILYKTKVAKSFYLNFGFYLLKAI